MAVYRFLAYSVSTSGGTDTPVAELPLKGVQFGSRLNAAGTLRGTIKLGDPAVGFDPLSATNLDNIAIYVERDGVLVWGGLVASRSYQHIDATLTITATEFVDWLDEVPIQATQVFAAADSALIARSLVAYAQTLPGANLNIVVGTETSGQTTNLVVNYYEARTVGQVVSDLSKMGINPTTGGQLGFDYAIDVTYDGSGNPSRALHIGYPRRGRIAGSTGLVFDIGTDALDYTWPEENASRGVSIFALGAGQGDAMLRATSTDTTQITNGAVYRGKVLPAKDITDQGMLNARAASKNQAVKAAVTTPLVKVRGSTPTQFGSYITGDDARVIFPPDPRWPQGLDTYLRIVSWNVQLLGDSRFEEIDIGFNTIPS